MKPYGKRRHADANRHLPGQSRPCPCCVPRKGIPSKAHLKKMRKRARQEGKVQTKEI